jgi:hypothetical protein
LFGYKAGSISGLLPMECLVLSLLIAEMALREFGVDILGWGLTN